MDKVKELIRVGARGAAVTELQRTLNQNGYNLKEDGVFGNNTLAAVKDYQKKNALSVDGVVGNNTWTALSGGSKTASGSGGSKSTADSGFSYKGYTESDTVKQAQAALNAQLAAKPGAYSSQWKAQIDDILARIQNREDFSYNVNEDALYQQYKDQYVQSGKQAMQDTMGQAAAMTGGYGNSYAATAGNQAYQAHLGELNEVVPELYQMALDRYTREGDELMDQYAILGDQEDQDYNRYMDGLNQYLTERDYLQGRYDTERDVDYGRYSDDKSYAYDEYQSEIAQDQWQKEYDEQVRQYNEQFDFQKQQYEDSKAVSKGSSGSSGGSSGGSSSGGSSSGSSASGSTLESGASKTSGVSDEVRTKLDGIKSNTAAEAYLENLEASGVIDHETALQLMGEYMDVNEVYKDNDDGSRAISYGDMVKSTSGWKVVDDGGINWFWGVDNNAIVEAPDGEKIRLDALVDKLVSEGMSKNDAKNYVKKLQKNLKI